MSQALKVTGRQKGQSAVEFALIAPFLFFIFFAIIQLAYMAYVSFAVQRAALSIARGAARSEAPYLYEPHFQLLYCLGPLATLNKTTLATALAADCSVDTDGSKVFVNVKYPMPIWVPWVGKVIGVPFSASFFKENSKGMVIGAILKFLGLDPQTLSTPGIHFPDVFWMTFTAECVDENSVRVPSL
jgi:hypothetical protein